MTVQMTKKMKLVRLTENEFHKLVENTTNKVLNESRQDNEIRLAQKELYKMNGNLSSIGMRLESTQFHRQYIRMRNEMVNLNNTLIDYLRKGK